MRDHITLIAVGMLSFGPGHSNAEGAPPQGLAAQVELAAQERLLEVVVGQKDGPVPFTTDGCSGGLSAGWAIAAQWIPGFEEVHDDLPPWQDCCVIHDRAYHAAGGMEDAASGYRARLHADEQLGVCVETLATERRDTLSEVYGMGPNAVERIYGLISAAMVQAVRIGGGPCTGLSWRWGYGYPNCPLTLSD